MKRAEQLRRFRVQEGPISSPHGWDTLVMSVFDGDTQVGEYSRNYPRFGRDTFEPFEIDGRWYALYSTDYTATRLMSLPDCRDLGGEEPHGEGFCPTAYFVPRYRLITHTNPSTGSTSQMSLFERDDDDPAASDPHWTTSPWRTFPLGFVSGCIWGDDSSWKLQTIDLSRVAEGVISREERFGYLELPEGSLADNISIELIRGKWRAAIKRVQHWDVMASRPLDPYE